MSADETPFSTATSRDSATMPLPHVGASRSAIEHALRVAGYQALPVTCSEVRLDRTISPRCGQAFRWREHAAAPLDLSPQSSALSPELAASPLARAWSLCLADRVVLLRQDPGDAPVKVEAGACQDNKPATGQLWHKTLFPSHRHVSAEDEQETAAWLRDYLNLSIPLTGLYTEWSARDPVFAALSGRLDGVRVLRQDPWECLCAFICSSNNNIARIGQMVQKLATHFAPPLLSLSLPEETAFHPFPPPEALAQPGVEAQLRALGFGYRAKYLAQTAQRLCEAHGPASPPLVQPEPSPPATSRRKQRSVPRPADEDIKPEVQDRFPSVQAYLLSLRTKPYLEAREHLMRLPGIGPKVADCILLFSQDQPSSIPVDRHVFAFAERKYHIRTKQYEVVAERLRDLWGSYAGWAHGILFLDDLRAFRQAQLAPAKMERQEEEDVHGEVQQAVEVKAELVSRPASVPVARTAMPATTLQLTATHRKRRPPPLRESARKRAATAASSLQSVPIKQEE